MTGSENIDASERAILNGRDLGNSKRTRETYQNNGFTQTRPQAAQREQLVVQYFNHYRFVAGAA